MKIEIKKIVNYGLEIVSYRMLLLSTNMPNESKLASSLVELKQKTIRLEMLN